MKLKLKDREWDLGEQVGRGGYGRVYIAHSSWGEAVAKLIDKDPGAQRELLFADLKDAVNVIPIIDSGETRNSWVIVMPRAEISLDDYLRKLNSKVEISEAINILSNIAHALASLDGRVVHRDIKPANILFHEGKWCLADFGISRYAEATTAPDTRKLALSKPYAAPERWKEERASIATDIYSLGIIAHKLLTGNLPFNGPDFREQHLHQDPPAISGVRADLASLIEECLYKPPGARPSSANLVARLQKMTKAPLSGGLASLQEANLIEAVRIGQAARREAEMQTVSEKRFELAKVGEKGLIRITEALREAIMEAAPNSRHRPERDGGWTLAINQAELRFSGIREAGEQPWEGGYPPALDVISYSFLTLSTQAKNSQYQGRSHSLWYCDAQSANHYQWFETAFMWSPLIRKSSDKEPFSLMPGEKSAKALSPSTTEVQVAWPFTPLTVGELDEFISRWGAWLATASRGELQRPSEMPERSPYESWRRR
ncbi:serine/threonine-protein kinase [Streptosporangium sp. NBC_01469]|uniref:serine/threonine-protein kinase n=1 Tax=Streptosporangium sp. NBC_01469 TaxID=2903898 RepID=UPI002E2A9B4E|nr:serine/threonine-protein kinase [Streptosporangium sp. NBC_01469]